MLILPPEITDKMWWRMCDANMDLPVPLAEADLSKPFVYERKWGVFYVPSGYHLLAMTILLSFQHNETNMFVVMEKLGIAEVHDAADYWLQHTEGAAFKSSVGSHIQVATKKSLSIQERRLFGDVTYVFD